MRFGTANIQRANDDQDFLYLIFHSLGMPEGSIPNIIRMVPDALCVRHPFINQMGDILALYAQAQF